MRRRRPSPALGLLLAPAIWGLSFPAAKVALEDLDPYPFMAWSRVLGLAAIMPLVLAVPAARRALHHGLVVPGVALGGLLTAGFAAQTEGLQETTATNAAFITGLYVVLVPLLGALLLRHGLRRDVVLAAGLAVVGLALLSLRGLEAHAGDGLVLLSAVLFAGHFLALGHWAPRHDVLALALAQMAAAAVMHVVLAVPGGGAEAGRAADAWIPLVLTGVLASGVAYGLQVAAQQAISPARAAIILGAESLFAALASALWLDERLSARQWLGAAVVVAAIVLSEVRAARPPPLDPATAA